MITIFHGDNIEASRKSFIEAIAKLKAGGANEVVRLNGAEIVLSDLIQALESQSLFGGDRVVAIEGLFSRRLSKEKDSLIGYLVKLIQGSFPSLRGSFSDRGNLNPKSDRHVPPTAELAMTNEKSIIIWEPKKITPASLKKLTGNKEVEIKEFKISGLLYKFLDQVIPGNGRPASLAFNNLIIEEPAELVFYLLVKRITELILENSSSGSGGGYDDWRKQNLIAQASKWTGKGLTNFHRKLTEIDEAVKTGSTPSGLPSHLDIALLNL